MSPIATAEIVQAIRSTFFASLPLIEPAAATNGTSTMEYEEERPSSPQRQLSSTLSSQAAELADFLLKAAHQQLNFIQRYSYFCFRVMTRHVTWTERISPKDMQGRLKMFKRLNRQ